MPVINENDTVATAEIRFGDNDRLAARVAEMVQADQLVLLSDIDGLYTADPRRDPAAAHIPVVAALTPEIEAMGGEPPPGYSSGGMRTKLVAARIATGAGCAMAIALGRVDHPLAALAEGRALHLVPAGARGRGAPARAGSWHAVQPPGGWWWMPVRRGRWRRAARCCRPACGRWRARSSAATRWRCGARTAACWRAGCPPTAAATPRASPGTAARRSRRSSAGAGRDEMIHRDDLVLLAGPHGLVARPAASAVTLAS